MKLLLLLLFGLALFGLLAGIIALFAHPLYAIALLIPSSIYIAAFSIAYTIESQGGRQR